MDVSATEGTAVTFTFHLSSQYFILLINNVLTYNRKWSEIGAACNDGWSIKTTNLEFYSQGDTASEHYRIICKLSNCM